MLQRVVLGEGGGGSQDGGDPQGCLVDTHALPVHFKGHGVCQGPLHSEPDQRFPDASENIPGCQPYSKLWNLLPG